MAANFLVKRLSKTVITAALPRPEHHLLQSNLDLLMPAKFDMNTFFCYRKPPGNGPTIGSIVNLLKEGLSKTLVPYYALAGELVKDAAGQPDLLCNNRGVDFVEAYADVKLQDLDLYKPGESIQGKLVPTLKNGVLAAQVTQLRCGGVVVGCTFDHRAADAHSMNMFWKSWAEMAQSKPLSTLPSFNRSLLSPRRPVSFHPSFTKMYVPISKFQPSSESETIPPTVISRIYSVPAKEIQKLQLSANHENPSSLIKKRTKLEAFSAFLWKLLAKEGDHFSFLGIAVDGRTRIAANGTMSNYFGNVVSNPYGEKKAKELEKMSLSSIANEIHNILKIAVNEEYFLGLIDYVEAQKPEPVVAKMFLGSKDDRAVIVSSDRGISLSEMNFGWGVPVFGSHLSPAGAPSGFVITMPSISGNGDWIVYMCLPKSQIDLIETSALHIIKPFTLG